jgi:hypothetical protein
MAPMMTKNMAPTVPSDFDCFGPISAGRRKSARKLVVFGATSCCNIVTAVVESTAVTEGEEVEVTATVTCPATVVVDSLTPPVVVAL